jgi:hypothetical protein
MPHSTSLPSILIQYDFSEGQILNPVDEGTKAVFTEFANEVLSDDFDLEDGNRQLELVCGSDVALSGAQTQQNIGHPPGLETIQGQNASLPRFQSLLPPDDLPVNEHVAHLFANKMDAFHGFNHCFSSAYYTLYLLSANNRVLRHVLFAFVTYLTEPDKFRQSAICKWHLQRALPQLQISLTISDFGDAETLAIPLLAYLAFWWRNREVAKSHVRGYAKMLLQSGYLVEDMYGRVSVTHKMPSLVLLMWRLLIELDHSFSFMDPTAITIPPINSVPQSNQRYVTDFINPSDTEWTEYLVRIDELEDLRHLVLHYDRRATMMRASGGFLPAEVQGYIEDAGEKIMYKVRELESEILVAATKYNPKCQVVFPSSGYSCNSPVGGRFIRHTPPYEILHERFIEAIIFNRATLVHATITSHQHPGPFPTIRLQAAIDICWALAVLKFRIPTVYGRRGRLLEALMFAGYTFCSQDYVLGILFIDDS